MQETLKALRFFSFVKLSIDFYIPLTSSDWGFNLVGVSISIMDGTLRVRRGKLWLTSNEQFLYTFRNRLWGLAVLKFK